MKTTYTKTRLFFKFFAVIILFVQIISIIKVTSLGTSPNNLTLNDALLFAVKNSPEIKSIKIDITKKKIERKEAIEAIQDIRKKESTVRFSLLFNIKFPSSHALPKEIDLIMKVPKIENDLSELNDKLIYEKLNAEFNAQNAYLNTIEQAETINTIQNQLNSKKEALYRIEADYKKGIAKREDYDSLLKDVDKTSQKLTSSLLRFENIKKNLEEITGQNLTCYEFNKDLYKTTINRDILRDIIKYSIDNDFEVKKAVRTSKLAQRRLQEILNIYQSRWGSKVSELSSMLSSGGEIDYNAFLDKYLTALDNIEEPWVGSYRINLLFFSISIPRDWFKGELDGIRYFEDQKYALYLALIERDKALKEEEKTRKELVKKLETTYNTLKELELAYENSLEIEAASKKTYQNIMLLNKLAKASFQEVECAKNSADDNSYAVFNSLLMYNKTLAMLQFYSSGGLSKFLQKASYDIKNYSSGNSFIEDNSQGDSDNSEKAHWYIHVPITDFKFYFGVVIPLNLKINVTHFALFTNDGTAIGGKTSIKETLSHLPIAFKDSSMLKLKLYKDNDVLYEEEIDGCSYGGELSLKKPSSKSIDNNSQNCGTWEITDVAGKYKSKLSLKFQKDPEFTHYTVTISNKDGDIVISSNQIDANTPFEHLTFLLKPSKITITLYKDKKIFNTAKLVTENGKDLIKLQN